MTRLAVFLLIAACYAQPRAGPYKVPEAKLEATYPKGLRVTVQGKYRVLCLFTKILSLSTNYKKSAILLVLREAFKLFLDFIVVSIGTISTYASFKIDNVTKKYVLTIGNNYF